MSSAASWFFFGPPSSVLSRRPGTAGWTVLCLKPPYVAQKPMLLKDEHGDGGYLACDDVHVYGSYARASENVTGHTHWPHDYVYGVHHHVCADAHELSLHEHDCDYVHHKLIKLLRQPPEEERPET